MILSTFLPRLRQARLVRVIAVYLGASWIVLEVTDVFIDKFGLPGWFFQAAILLLLIGFITLVTTAWVQARPEATAGTVPTPWEVDLVDLKDSVKAGRLPHLTWARAIVGGVVAFSLLFGFAGLYVLMTGRAPSVAGPREAVAAAAPGIAVLPFRTVGPDMELWREGMVDLLSTNLDGAAGLRSIDPRTVISAWVRSGGESEELDLQRGLQLSRAVGARYALLGSAVSLAGGVRLSADVYDVQTGELQGRAQVEGSPDSVFALVDGLSLEILRAGLVNDPAELPELALRGVTTSSVPALKAYLAGEQKFRRSYFRDAISDFTRAVDEDSTFALALYRISQAYGWIESFSERTAEFGDRAARFADRLPRREALLLKGNSEIDEFDVAAIETLTELTDLYPDDVEAWQLLGEAYFHLGEQRMVPRDRFREAFGRAIELDPQFAPVYFHLIDDALVHGDSVEARALIARHRSIDPNNPHAEGLALVSALALGDSIERENASAALETASADALFTAFARFYWSTVQNSAAIIEVAEAIFDPRHPASARGFGFWGSVRGYGVTGRVREARAAADEVTRTLGNESLARSSAIVKLEAHLLLYPDFPAARTAAEYLAADSAPDARFFIGALAASAERWGDVEAVARVLEVRANEAESDDPAASGRAYAEALRGYADLRRGDSRAALRGLQGGLAGVGDPDVNSLIRYEIGKLLLRMGQLREAERYLVSLELYGQGSPIVSTPADYYLGEVYEALGEPEKAKLHYGRFVRMWEDADPELHEWRERARNALERLTRETAGS